LSLNVRYGLSTNSSLELTLNPDFSQWNRTPVRSMSTKPMPCFLTSADRFSRKEAISTVRFSISSTLGRSTIRSSPESSPTIRTVFAGLPVGPGRAFAAAGAAAGVDRDPLAGEITVNILRGRQTFGQDSYIGFVVTDRRTDADRRVDTLYEPVNDSVYDRSIDTVRYAAGSGSSFGLDGRFRLTRNLKFEFMGGWKSHPRAGRR